MRPIRLASLAVFLLAFPCRADPGDAGRLRFWVQTGGDPTMLHSLVSGDTRISPIIVVRTPHLYNHYLPGTQCQTAHDPITGQDTGTGHWCPEVVACNAALQVDLVTAGIDLSSGQQPIGIMIQGFGVGGRSTLTPNDAFHFPAPALARPPTLNVSSSNPCRPGMSPNFIGDPAGLIPNDPTGRVNNDYQHNPTPAVPGYWTPWFDFGPTDCAQWLHEFAVAYSDRVEALATPPTPNRPGPGYFQPTRLIMDLEDDIAPVSQTELTVMKNNLLNDTSRNNRPVQGMPLNGLYFPGIGPTIQQLADPLHANYYNPPCDGPGCWQGAVDRLWMTNICRQTQNSAMFRAIVQPDPVPGNLNPTPPLLGFRFGNWPLWSNFGYATTNGQIDVMTPPYDKDGNALRKVAYRDNLYYESYRNFADFHSPVSYGIPRHLNTTAVLGGGTASDWLLQATRETLDSILFSLPHPTGGGVATTNDTFMTPWIAGANQYVVSIDHHRKLLALMRSKRCHEYNVFMNGVQATPLHCMGNWTHFRRVVDQVYGFDLDFTQSAVSAGTTSDDINGDGLEYSECKSVAVVAGAFPLTEPAPPNASARMAQVITRFKVWAPFGASNQSADLTIANSANLRINVEYNAPDFSDVDPPQGGTPDAAPELQVAVFHPGKMTWIPVQMSAVGAPHGSGLPGSRRYVMTGMIDNTGHRLVNLTGNFDVVGTVQVKVGLSANANFTTKFDMIQMVGVSTLPSCPQLDWNHDGAVNFADLMSYFDDAMVFFNREPQIPLQPASTGGELWALDANGDGWVDSRDICAFQTLINGCSPLTPAEIQLFTDTVSVLTGTQGQGQNISFCNQFVGGG